MCARDTVGNFTFPHIVGIRIRATVKMNCHSEIDESHIFSPSVDPLTTIQILYLLIYIQFSLTGIYNLSKTEAILSWLLRIRITEEKKSYHPINIVKIFTEFQLLDKTCFINTVYGFFIRAMFIY